MKLSLQVENNHAKDISLFGKLALRKSHCAVQCLAASSLSSFETQLITTTFLRCLLVMQAIRYLSFPGYISFSFVLSENSNVHKGDFVVGNMIGHVRENRYYLATHLVFNIIFNRDLGVSHISCYLFILQTIIKATVEYDAVQNTTDITETNKIEVEFTYSIRWHETILKQSTINK